MLGCERRPPGCVQQRFPDPGHRPGEDADTSADAARLFPRDPPRRPTRARLELAPAPALKDVPARLRDERVPSLARGRREHAQTRRPILLALLSTRRYKGH